MRSALVGIFVGTFFAFTIPMAGAFFTSSVQNNLVVDEPIEVVSPQGLVFTHTVYPGTSTGFTFDVKNKSQGFYEMAYDGEFVYRGYVWEGSGTQRISRTVELRFPLSLQMRENGLIILSNPISGNVSTTSGLGVVRANGGGGEPVPSRSYGTVSLKISTGSLWEAYAPGSRVGINPSQTHKISFGVSLARDLSPGTASLILEVDRG